MSKSVGKIHIDSHLNKSAQKQKRFWKRATAKARRRHDIHIINDGVPYRIIKGTLGFYPGNAKQKGLSK